MSVVPPEYGLPIGGSTGAVLAAVKRYGILIEDEATVVAISPDLGEKYLASIYNDDWVRTTVSRPLGVVVAFGGRARAL